MDVASEIDQLGQLDEFGQFDQLNQLDRFVTPTVTPPAARRPSSRRVFAVLVLTATLCATAPRMGSAATDPQAAEAALGALKLAQLEYRDGHYAEAARLFYRAYELDPIPGYLFNAARAEQRSFKLDAAEAAFERFLALPTGSAEAMRRARLHLDEVRATRDQMARAKAEGRTELEAKLRAEAEVRDAAADQATASDALGARPDGAKTDGTKTDGAKTDGNKAAPGGQRPVAAAGATPATAAPATMPATPDSTANQVRAPARVASAPSGGWKRTAAWSGLWGGVIAAAAGTWLWLGVEADQRDLNALTAKLDIEDKVVGVSWGDYERTQSELNRRRPVSQGLTAVGVVAAGIGGWWLVRAGPQSASATIGVGPRRVQLAWSF